MRNRSQREGGREYRREAKRDMGEKMREGLVKWEERGTERRRGRERV